MSRLDGCDIETFYYLRVKKQGKSFCIVCFRFLPLAYVLISFSFQLDAHGFEPWSDHRIVSLKQILKLLMGSEPFCTNISPVSSYS